MDFLRYFLLANLLLAVVTGAFYVLLRRETFFNANRITLWLGLAGSLIVPLLELPDWRPQPVRTVMQRTAQVITENALKAPLPAKPDVIITFPNGRTYPAFKGSVSNERWPWHLWLVVGYIIVVIALLLRFGWQLTSLLRLLQKSIHEEYDDFVVAHSEGVTSPFSFFSWVVVNPGNHAPDELDQILRHERVHVRERHSLDMIAAELVCILFWFNPAAYLFRRLVHQTLEYSADRAVLLEGVEAKAYQYSLIKVSLMTGR